MPYVSGKRLRRSGRSRSVSTEAECHNGSISIVDRFGKMAELDPQEALDLLQWLFEHRDSFILHTPTSRLTDQAFHNDEQEG